MLAVVVIKDGVCIKQGVSLGTRPLENWKEGLEIAGVEVY